MAIKPIRVSQFNNYVKRVLQTDPLLGNVSVIGEISNLNITVRGMFFYEDEDSKHPAFFPPIVKAYELSKGGR